MTPTILDEIRLLERLIELLEELRGGRNPDRPEELVELISTLGPGLGESHTPMSAVFRDAGAVAADLAKLQLGPPPSDLPSNMAGIWARNREAWLTEDTRNALERELSEALAPLEANSTSIDQQQKLLAVRAERLETLAALLSLLDALAGLPPASHVASEGTP